MSSTYPDLCVALGAITVNLTWSIPTDGGSPTINCVICRNGVLYENVPAL